MGFSDWVFSYLVILHLGDAGGNPPAFPVRQVHNKHLPIYKYDLTIYFEKIVRNFTRYHSGLGKRASQGTKVASPLPLE